MTCFAILILPIALMGEAGELIPFSDRRSRKNRRSKKGESTHSTKSHSDRGMRSTPKKKKTDAKTQGQSRASRPNKKSVSSAQEQAPTAARVPKAASANQETGKSLPIAEVLDAPARQVYTRDNPICDTNLPKSKPKNEADQYIKKRLIIAGSYYCEKDAIEKLQIGVYFDLIREPQNPYDADAIMLVLDNQKIGYVAKEDLPPFIVALKLGRRIYGVITDIIAIDGTVRYEFETWFDRSGNKL